MKKSETKSCTTDQDRHTDVVTDKPANESRRAFMATSALLGAAGAVGLGLNPTTVFAKDGGLKRSGASGFEPLEVNSPMARWKKPQPLEFVEAATKRYSFPNWQSGNDDSVFYNLNIPSFFKSRVVAAPDQFSVLERDIQADLLDLTFTNLDGSTNPPLRDYLVGPRQVQAMMMAHKGKVVFETYPGMNPMDYHVWMSASKTTAGLVISTLANEGKIDLDKPVSTYAPELAGSAWDNITVKNTMNMAVALDNEETFESLVDPKSWISSFFTSVFTGGDDPSAWRKLLKGAQPLPNEKPGDRFRYSTSNTQVLVLIAEHITKLSWEQYWNERVWSKIGARNPFIVGLTPDGTPVAGGLIFTTVEDMLRYAMIYTPSWNVVAEEKIVSDELLKQVQTLGDPAAYQNSTELAYGQRWFGETPALNTAQWDHAFEDGAMFKHGNMGQGIYVDPARDFCGVYFGLATNDEKIAGVDHSPGYLRAAAKKLAGG
ncbi:MAG: serine hydrolase domain-containing protein [Sedimenticolaceae bacterium]|jgi:CubicO group peptidase (beta-lactamase class C family)